MGVGFAYVTPIATCIKWFPDKRGMIVGLAVMGFGAGSLIFAPLLEALIGTDASRYRETIPRTFLVMAAIFLVCVIGSAQFYRVPPAGWRPAGWSPPQTAGVEGTQDFTPREMLGTWQFYVLWLIYFLGTSVGLTAIGQASPIIREMGAEGAALTGGAALGVMSFFNGIGRLSWGSLSDKLGRNRTAVAMYAVYAVACLALLRTASGFWPLLVGLCMVGFSFGGYFALLPSFTADYFGSRHVGANYGIMFTAYGCTRRRETRPGTPRERRTLAEQKQTAGNLSQETVPGGAFRGIPEGCTQWSYMHAFGERFMLRGRANGR